MEILTIVGARPQFVKAAPVSRALSVAGITDQIIHTGQHFDPGMSDIFFRELGIPAPAHHLGVSGGGHGAMTGAILQRLEPILEAERPDWVLVYGDTNSTVAGALAAAKLHIPVGHVEAGLRSFNRRMPEELNRVVTDHIADLLFTPTNAATINLAQEGIRDTRISQVGDVMFDAVLHYASKASEYSTALADFDLRSGAFILATVHRAENTDNIERLRTIITELDAVADAWPVLLPIHPRTRMALERNGINTRRIRLIEPVGYLDMVALESNAAVIATDSGGVQKEAYFHGVPCVTLREETEWIELVELGWNRLAPPETSNIARIVLDAVGTRGKEARPYGDGQAAGQIAMRLAQCRKI